ncbi:PRC-barrel domain-containing protein [Sphingomonas baiyangensis]|uniref:PRC-barrel domain containing protein n=1 Tax=Sphingomonas baiyangensis TaxID=2572576 RepID=A0A4U1L4G0_9SPHN|nr:PRC-barrel domain-containing protein [Sphingomonas baiyangensis]TKD51065.1 PRC-barrel domain containing protein [Sphingomonas baiyangensis]
MAEPSRPGERLIASDRVEDTAVHNRDGEKLGHVERLLIDRASGQVEYAVLAFGGILGIGHRHFPLPWQALHYDRAQGAYVVDLTREQIEGAPSYEDEEPRYDLPYAQQLHAYYGLAYM